MQASRDPLRTIVVTGSTGFVGRHVRTELERRHWRVIPLFRRGSPRTPNAIVDTGDASSLEAEFTNYGVRAVVHLATHFVAHHKSSDVTDLVDTNVGLSVRVMEAAAKAGVDSFVNASTAWQHVEGEPYRPLSLYAATKQAAEDILLYYSDIEGLSTKVLTLFDTYGPEDERMKLVPMLIASLQTDEPVPMSSGHQLIDLVHVSDVARAFADLAESTAPNGRWVLSSGAAITVRTLVDTIGKVAGKPVQAVFGARPDRPREMRTPWNIGEAPPNWGPSISLESGLEELLNESENRPMRPAK